jgi:hypothetical protein
MSIGNQEAVVSLSLELNTQQAEASVRQCLTLLNKTLYLVQQLGGGDPDVQRLINNLNRAIALMNQLRLTVIALEAASGPVGWALAGVGLALTALSATDFVQDMFYDATRG